TAQENRIHVQLRNLPPTAIPADLRRVITRERIENVNSVMLDYNRFAPTGRAYFTVTHPDFLRPCIKALQNASVSSIPITAQSAPSPNDAPPTRTRGAKGRAEAVQRSIITGNGPNGGIWGNEKCVVMWGLPGKLEADALKKHLADFTLASSEGGQREVIRLDGAYFSLYSRHLVRLESVAEAHRLVRQKHMTYYEREEKGEKYLIHARVVY
ncbi:hypothetical protein PLICRDRAFT_110952, partial [Plicaturopsis crispa FD-325 SS-3]